MTAIVREKAVAAGHQAREGQFMADGADSAYLLADSGTLLLAPHEEVFR